MIAQVLVLIAALHRSAPQQETGEYELKAATLLVVARNVVWPEGAFEKADTPFRIGMLGTDRFGNHLTNLSKKTLKGRKVEIVRETDPEKLKGCNVVFVSDSEKGKVGDILNVFKGRPTLVMGDTEGFGKRGVGVNLSWAKDDKGEYSVEFELNHEALENSGLTPSAELLQLRTKTK